MSSNNEKDSVAEIKNWKLNFFPIWIGQFISSLGSELVRFALIWHLTDTTGSAVILTTSALASALPQILLSPFIGALIDRWNRKKVMIAADSFIAFATLVLGFLFAFNLVQLWHIYAILVIRSIGSSFHYPAMVSSVSLMVPKKQLVRMQGLNQITQGILMLFAAPMGALLLELLPISQIFWIDVTTAVIAIVPLIFCMIPQPKLIHKDVDPALELKPIKRLFNDTKEGFLFVLNWRSLFTLTLMMLTINFFLTPAFSLQSLLVKTHFNAGALELSYAQFSFGLGFLLGGVLLSTWGGFKRKILSTMLGIFLVGITTLSIGLFPSDGIIGLYLSSLIMGTAIPLANGPSQALRQEVIAPEMQGRYFALQSSLSSMMSPISLAFAGPLAEIFGIQVWYLVGGGVCILMSIIGSLSPFILSVENGPPQKEIPVS